MKYLILCCAVLGQITRSNAQKSENYIPKDAVTVFSLNNIELMKKISMDQLVTYQFMDEVHQELFDGSTAGKTLKDSGIDFDQKMNVYFGVGKKYEVAGFTFGIKDLTALFKVFDDFEEQDSPIEGVKLYSSYFNHLFVKDGVGILIRVDPVYRHVRNFTDSIWELQGGGSKYSYQYEYTESDEVFDVEEEVEEMESEGEYLEETEVPIRKNYNELRDSVETELKAKYLTDIGLQLFVYQDNLCKNDKDLRELMAVDAEGIFYLDNSRNLSKNEGFAYFQTMFPQLLSNLQDLYAGNKIMGELRLDNTSVTAHIRSEYGEVLGEIYETLNSAKFDKNVANYIHKNNTAYFTYNVNLREAYEEAFKTLMPMLRAEKNPRIAPSVLAIDLLNEFINKDAFFGTYRGSMFGTFNGIKTVNVKRIEYSYDEDFNYTENEVESQEEMPVFTLGFSTKRNDIPEKVLNHIANMTSECKKMGEVWRINDAIFNSIPLYIINKNGLFILTNDEELALYQSDGYGADKLSKQQIKTAKKSGFVYANIDFSRTISNLPRNFFSAKQIDLLDTMEGKTGNLVLSSSKTTKKYTEFEIKYQFNTTYVEPGEHVLDLVNSLFLILN